MTLVSVRIITDDAARLVGFYELLTGVPASWATDDFAELRTTSGTLAIGSTRTVALFGAGVAEPAANRTAIVEFNRRRPRRGVRRGRVGVGAGGYGHVHGEPHRYAAGIDPA